MPDVDYHQLRVVYANDHCMSIQMVREISYTVGNMSLNLVRSVSHDLCVVQDDKTRNCLSSEMMGEIIDALEGLEARPEVKVVVLTHSGKVSWASFATSAALACPQVSKIWTSFCSQPHRTCIRCMLLC